MAAIVVVGGRYYLEAPEAPQNISDGAVDSEHPVQVSSTRADGEARAKASSPEHNVDTYGPLDLSRQQIVEVNEWMAANGYDMLLTTEGVINHEEYKTPPVDSYQTYDSSLLGEVAESGDAHAALTLGKRLYAERNFDEAVTHLHAAAVHGYANALNLLSALYSGKSRDLRRNGDPSYQKALIESFAWQVVFDLRFYPKREPRIDSESLSKRLGKEQLDEAKQAILARGNSLYDELKRSRKVRGYPELDNYIPDIGSLSGTQNH